MIGRIVSFALFALFVVHPFLEVVGERWKLPSYRASWIQRPQKGWFQKPCSWRNEKDPLLLQTRGGTEEPTNDDEERYSRQVYTLGARAHGLIRSATVYIDGPMKSGLVYECAKNLALSGIGKIVLLSSAEDSDEAYHSDKFDDLGATYIKGASTEVDLKEESCASDIELLREYIHRLNPSLDVQVESRDVLNNEHESGRGILLCIDRPFDTKLKLNRLCRRLEFPFVAAETAGVYGLAFSDFGTTFQVHDVDGETPLVIPLDRVEAVDDEEGSMLVRCVSGERHDVSRGDELQFQLSTGEKLDVVCTVEKVKSPELVIVRPVSDDISMEELIATVNSKASTFTRLKKIEEISFAPLDEATASAKENPSLFVPSDLDKSFDDTRRNAILSCFMGLNTFANEFGRLPTAEDTEKFLLIAKQSWSADSSESQEWNKHCQLFVRTCEAKFVPHQAIFGAIASQECLKAASGLYNPIRQFLLYDCDEVLPTNLGDNEASAAPPSGLSYIFGEKITSKFQKKRIFVVGAGAIGCELLKNLAAMGAGTNKKGAIVITDMDTIEQSNLSRQLLFRDGDIGKFKSQAAQEAVGRLNPSLNLECHVSRVGDDEHGPFDFKFWSENVDVVLNALDNVEARLFIDSQCVANELGLVDAGTLGSKGNVQVIVPHETESYGSSADPPEPSIPVCTLKNFPYAISHTIQWGRDLFEGLFARRPKTSSRYLESLAAHGLETLIDNLESDIGGQEALDTAKEIKDDVDALSSKGGDALRAKCLAWAVALAEDLFYEKIVDLLAKHPIDSLDEDNEPFWSGSRKAPTPLQFSADDQQDSQQDAVNRNYVDFVRNAARLRMETFLGVGVELETCSISIEEAEAALQSSKGENNISPTDGDASVETILNDLPSASGDVPEPLVVAEFEKDDETNGHVAFITAASNLRAICYGIPPVDAMETRKVAGNIVPAMVTTTAFVSALSCVELFKLVQKSTLRNYRNSFINLALPFFASTTPLPAEPIEGLRGKTFTLWDRLVIKESKKAAAAGGISLRRLLKRLKKEIGEEAEGVEISSISYGPYLIYASFLHEDEAEHLEQNIWNLIANAVDSADEFDNEFSRESTQEISTGRSQNREVVELTVMAEDMETGEEIGLPPVRVFRRLEQ